MTKLFLARRRWNGGWGREHGLSISVVRLEGGQRLTLIDGYDPNGNLTAKTDARNITTGYSYDALNRVTQRTYSDSTLPVYFTYDNLSHAKGKLTKVTTGSGSTPFSVTEYTEFDAVGRVKKSRQTTDGTAYNEMEYTYNLSGALVEEKYPSGRVVRNVLDNEGDLSMVRSRKNANYGYWSYAHHFTYTAAGAVSSMQLGNGTWEKTAFNSRLQPTQIALGKVQNATDLLKLDYTYGVVESGTLNTAKNNGNIQSQTITVPAITGSDGFTAVQTYNYDSLNRIDDASEKIGSAEIWKQDYTFDRYGNRNFDEANTTTIPKYCANNSQVCPADRKVLNPSISASTNRINLEQDGDSVNDYAFDSSGNTTKDANGRTFVYDAENKQIEVKNASDETIGKYWYDGDGRRVKKRGWINGQWEETIFVYDASSRLVAEYSTILNPTPQVAYLTNDHLGSPRINTDENGKVTARHDYRPYGEEVAERTHAQYAGDTIRKQFTGYERDGETDEDFAEARYYNYKGGRFDSVDPLMASANINSPQTFNRYSYVTNNPLSLTDPSGMKPCPPNENCQNDDQGNEYFIKDGSVVYTGVVASVVTVGVKEAVKEVAKETIQIIEPKWYEMLWYYTKKAATTTGKGVLTIGRAGGAIITMLTNPSPVGCSGRFEKPDGNGGCTIDQEKYDERQKQADNQPNADVNESPELSKKRTERPDTGFRNIPDEEISRRARDRSLPGPERKKYQKEEKVRGDRNKKKRGKK